MRELIFLFVMSFSVNAAEDLSNQIRIVEVAGAVKEVKVIRAVGKKEAPLRSGEILFVGDEVQVAPRQVVVLQAYDGSQWKLAPETQFRIESRKPDPKTFAYWTFQLTKGSMWGAVKKDNIEKDGFRLKVRTKTASMGIRGTEYFMMGDEKRSVLDVLEGSVWWGKDPAFAPGSYQEISAGHRAEIGADGRISVTENKKNKAQLVKDYGLDLGVEGNSAMRGSAQQCISLGKGWKSIDGSNLGECVEKSE